MLLQLAESGGLPAGELARAREAGALEPTELEWRALLDRMLAFGSSCLRFGPDEGLPRRTGGRTAPPPPRFAYLEVNAEGRAAVFAGARWGEFRVAADGTALLTHLRDQNLQRLGETVR